MALPFPSTATVNKFALAALSLKVFLCFWLIDVDECSVQCSQKREFETLSHKPTVLHIYWNLAKGGKVTVTLQS